MIRNGLILLASAGFLACDVPDTALLVHGQATAKFDEMANTCTFKGDPDDNDRPLWAELDTASSHTLEIPLIVENNLADTVNDISTGGGNLKNDMKNSATPLRYSLQWECDNSAFSGQGLIIPHFDAATPFCYDKRNEQTPASFFGFDVVPVFGASIAPTESRPWRVQVVPPEFGQHIDDAFRIAAMADECCSQDNDNCTGTVMGGKDCANDQDACACITEFFQTLDPNGEKGLTVASDDPEVPSPLLQRLAPFSVFDNLYANSPTFDSRKYSVRQRGVFEAAMPDGETIQSSQTITSIRLGRYMSVDTVSPGCQTQVCRFAFANQCLN